MHFAPILLPSEYSGDGGENLEFVQEVEVLSESLGHQFTSGDTTDNCDLKKAFEFVA